MDDLNYPKNSEVGKWVGRSNRKLAKLVATNGDTMTLVFFHKNKVRIGEISHGAYCRYGIRTRGAMYSENIMSLWQSAPR